jgi:hypothetical protein
MSRAKLFTPCVDRAYQLYPAPRMAPSLGASLNNGAGRTPAADLRVEDRD